MVTVTSRTGAVPDPRARAISAVSEAVSIARSAERIRSVYDRGSSKTGGTPRAWLMNSPSRRSDGEHDVVGEMQPHVAHLDAAPHRRGLLRDGASSIEPSVIATMSETVAHRGQPMTSSVAGSARPIRAPRTAGLGATLSLE